MLKQKKEYRLEYDLMNILSCIAVVALHVNCKVWAYSQNAYWYRSLLVTSLLYWAVPIFVMISGATLIDYRKRYDTVTFLKKRFARTVVPFLFWSVFSIFWAMYLSGNFDLSGLTTWQGVINKIINFESMPVYWFFATLFSLYLCMPVLGAIPEEHRKKVFGYMIVYAYVSCSLVPFLAPRFGLNVPMMFQSPLNGSGGYVIFLLIGYWITHYPISQRLRLVIYTLGIAGLIYMLYYSYSMSLLYGGTQLVEYTNFANVLLSTAVFTWFVYHDYSAIKSVKIIQVIRKIAGASLGIYLIHNYIILYADNIIHLPMESLVWQIGGVFVVYLLSLTIVLIGKKVPLLKNVLP